METLVFLEEGQLRSVETGEPFRYEFFNDRVMNENRYQEIAKVSVAAFTSTLKGKQ